MYSGPGTRPPLSPAEFTALLEQQQEALYRFLWGLVRDAEQARDLLQDTFHDAWRLARQHEPPFLADSSHEEMRYWLFRVAYHRAISVLRRRRRIRWESLEERHEREPEVFSGLRSLENDIAEREALRAALERLSSQDVACLLLRLVQGFTASEVAQILGASPGQITQRLARAKRRLRSIYLTEDGQLKDITDQKGVPS
jgi:RNA polymerase sigma-70 factor (ECF subfamily)